MGPPSIQVMAIVPRVSCGNREAEARLKGRQGCLWECKGMDQIRRAEEDDEQN